MDGPEEVIRCFGSSYHSSQNWYVGIELHDGVRIKIHDPWS